MSSDINELTSDLLARNWRRTLSIMVLVSLLSGVCYFYVDVALAEYIEHHLPKVIDELADVFTGAGDWILIVGILVALYARFKTKNAVLFRLALFPVACSLVAGVFCRILKIGFGRWRPKGHFKYDGEYGFEPFTGLDYYHTSFPSGHAAGGIAILVALALYFPKWRVLCIAGGCLIGATRILLNAHYMGDVVAGLGLGYLTTHWLYYHALRRDWLPIAALPR